MCGVHRPTLSDAPQVSMRPLACRLALLFAQLLRPRHSGICRRLYLPAADISFHSCMHVQPIGHSSQASIQCLRKRSVDGQPVYSVNGRRNGPLTVVHRATTHHRMLSTIPTTGSIRDRISPIQSPPISSPSAHQSKQQQPEQASRRHAMHPPATQPRLTG